MEDLTATTVTQANNVVESTTGNFGPAPTRTTNYYYDDTAHPADQTRVVNPNGNTTTTTYDTFGDKASVTDPKGDKTTYGYDTARGWLTAQVDPNGTAAGITPGCTPPAQGCTTYGHDAWGDVTSTTDPLEDITTATFDADGNQTSTTDANHNTVTSTFDPADLRVKTTQADATTQVTDYNPNGTVADTIDGLGDKTRYGYDGQARRDSRTDPDNRTASSHIDPAGRVLTTTDAAGRVTTMGYDPAGHVTSVSYSDGVTPNVSYGYDPDGNKVSMTDGTGTTTWTYDTFNELVSQTQGSGATVGYGYDNDGDTTSIAYPGQTTAVIHGFDTADRLASVTDFAGNKTTFGYDSDRHVLTTAFPNGTTVTNGYNNREDLTSTNAVTGSATVLSASYGRDPTGQSSSQTVGGVTRTFGYTPREQLASDTTSGATTGYGQDAANNPTTVGVATQAFDPAGQECWSTTSTVTNPMCGMVPAGATTYTFDSVGDRTKTTPATGTATTYSYDQAGRLTSASGPNGSGTYTYDGDGLRVAKTVAGVTSTLVWDNESTPNVLTDTTNSYLYGPDGLPIEQTSAAGNDWFVHDQVGSTLALLGSTGQAVGGYTYTAYGVATHSGSAITLLRYTGQYTDAESGMIYLRARYYDPATAQFLTLDPKIDTTKTPYAYTGDDPVNAIDLTGLDFWDNLIGGFAIAGAVVGAGICVASVACGGGLVAVGLGEGALDVGAVLSWGVAGAAGGAAAGQAARAWSVVGQDGDWGDSEGENSGSTPPGVKPGWTSRVSDNGKGTVYQRPGASGNQDSIRIMGPTEQYPNGYVRFYNGQGQPVDLNGKPTSQAETHIPCDADGNYPIPKGW